MRVLLIGKSSGRLDCIAETIRRSKRTEIFILTNMSNLGLAAKGFVTLGPTDDPEFVAEWAEKHRSGDYTVAIISNEEPLAAGVADALNKIGIPTVGPTKALAQIESSKSFTRKLLHDSGLAFMNPNWGVFEPGEINRVESYMHAFRHFVIKPDSLTGGKGVKVMGNHFYTIEEGLQYCQELFNEGGKLLIEQKQEGPEFSMMSFCDGNTIVHMPAVQDHKRLLDYDQGPNTGGMGSYSGANHSLPFLTPNDIFNATTTNYETVAALQKHIGQPYKGIIYGNYIVTSRGLRLIEFNCRFGDPEVMNVLPLLETDFGDILQAMVTGKLSSEMVKFANKATVCKYLVPMGHPDNPQPGSLLMHGIEKTDTLRVYRGALDGVELTGSRAAAVVGIAETISKAEKIAEAAANLAVGPVFHRKDIGTYESVVRRIEHADLIRKRI